MSRFIYVFQVQLERLDVTNNDLSGLPAELGALRDVKAIVLDGNPMRKIRRDIITRGTMAIMQHLRNQVDGQGLWAPGAASLKLFSPTHHRGTKINPTT